MRARSLPLSKSVLAFTTGSAKLLVRAARAELRATHARPQEMLALHAEIRSTSTMDDASMRARSLPLSKSVLAFTTGSAKLLVRAARAELRATHARPQEVLALRAEIVCTCTMGSVPKNAQPGYSRMVLACTEGIVPHRPAKKATNRAKNAWLTKRRARRAETPNFFTMVSALHHAQAGLLMLG